MDRTASRKLDLLAKLEEDNKKWVAEVERLWHKLNDLAKSYDQLSNEKVGGEVTNERLKELELRVALAENDKKAAEAKLEMERQKQPEGVALGGNLNEKLQEMVRGELQRLVKDEQTKAEEIKEQVRVEMNKQKEAWKAEDQKDKQGFRELMNQQIKEQQQGIEKRVVNVIKNKESLVRDIADKKKCVILFGIREEKITVKADRVEYDNNKIMSVLDKLNDDGWLRNELVEHTRLGKYEDGKDRPIKLKFNTQAAAEFMLYSSWKLHSYEELKKVFIRRNMSEEEREKLREMITEAKDRNEERSEEEKEQFFWRVRHEKLVKWFIRDERREQRRDL